MLYLVTLVLLSFNYKKIVGVGKRNIISYERNAVLLFTESFVLPSLKKFT